MNEKTTNSCCGDKDNNSGCGMSCGNIPPNKMCQLTKTALKFDVEKVKKLTSDSKYICKCCGRTANDKDRLCSPVSLK